MKLNIAVRLGVMMSTLAPLSATPAAAEDGITIREKRWANGRSEIVVEEPARGIARTYPLDLSTHHQPAASEQDDEAEDSLSDDPAAPSPSWVLRDDKPAPRWDHGYMIGNGRLGAMTQGLFPQSVIHFNEDTVWKSGNRPRVEAGVRTEGIQKAFEACLDGDYMGAEAHYCRAKNKGGNISTWQGLGDLTIAHRLLGAEPTVARTLDLYHGVARAAAADGAGTVRETLLASYPDQCIVVRLERIPRDLNCRIDLSRAEGITEQFAQGRRMGFTGQTANNGTRFHCVIEAVGEGGTTVTADGNGLVVQDGPAATLVIAVATDHNYEAPREPRTDDWKSEAVRRLDKAVARGWEALKARATADHAGLMSRFELDLGTTSPDVAGLTTPERLKRVRGGEEDPDLVESLLQLGRHMLVSSSRPGSLPPNLWGVWGPGLHSSWNGDFHLNVNVQMNLWPANVTGLEECHMPFFQMLKWLHRYGKATAASMGCRGYAACLATDPWGYAEFHNGSPEWDSTVLGGHWAQQHLMEYYRFTGDKAFLEQVAWPILQDGARFILDWLRENPENGKLITGPGGSPENRFVYTNKDGKEVGGIISVGNTFDLMIARETLTDALECAGALGIDDDLTRTITRTLPRIQDYPINSDGRLGEWWRPFKEVWIGHRHKSHLYGLYPGYQITRGGTPELYKAAEASMEMRMADRYAKNDACWGPVGWNLAWSTALWARLQRADMCYRTIHQLLRLQANENLADRCLQHFCVDGNFGVTAGIVEMLAQSHEQDADGKTLLRLLPALSEEWPEGRVRGIRCRNGFLIEEMSWKDGKLEAASIRSRDGGAVRVRYRDEKRTFTTKPGERFRVEPGTPSHRASRGTR